MQGKKKKAGDEGGDESLTRIAIVSDDKCKPKKCKQECKRSCPVVRMGKLCIEVSPANKTAQLSSMAVHHTKGAERRALRA